VASKNAVIGVTKSAALEHALPEECGASAVCAAPIADRMIQVLDVPAFGASHLTGTALAVARAFTTLDPVGGLRHD